MKQWLLLLILPSLIYVICSSTSTSSIKAAGPTAIAPTPVVWPTKTPASKATPTAKQTNVAAVRVASSSETQGFSPNAMVVTADGKYAFLGFGLSEVILKVRLQDLAIEAAADLSTYFPMETSQIALDASEKKLFVSVPTWRKLLVLDTESLNVIYTFDNFNVIGMFRSQYGSLLVTWNGGTTVDFVNTDTYAVTELTDNAMFFLKIQESKSDPNQWYVVYAQQPGTAWGNLGVYDRSTKTLLRTFPLPKQGTNEIIAALRVLPNEQKAYVGTFGGWYPENHAYGWLYSIDLVGGQVKAISIDGGLGCLEASPDSQRVYIGTGWPVPNTNNLLFLNTSSDAVEGNIYLGTNRYGWNFTQMDVLRVDPSNPNLLYATSTDGNALLKVRLDSLSLADVRVLNKEDFHPIFFARRPSESAGYILITKSANAFNLDLNQATINGFVTFPSIRTDVYAYDVVMTSAGRLLIAQGDRVLEVDQAMHLIATHPLANGTPSFWNFVISKDQSRLYSITYSNPNTANNFLAINTASFQTVANFQLAGGTFEFRPFELPDGSKLYALGGMQNGSVVVQVIRTDNYSIQKTITFSDSGLLGIAAGPAYPFAYDSASHTLYAGATQVVLAIDTDTDVIKKVIRLQDVATAIGLASSQFTYINAGGLVYNPTENYLYIAHADRSFVSVYDLNNNRFLSHVIPLQGYGPAFLFANDGYSRIYSLNGRSDSVSVIDVNSKSVEKVLDLHDYLKALYLPLVLRSTH